MPKRTDISKILILGSGPIIIGQSAEFDYSGTQACKALKSEGYEVVLANSNPATIMTDPEVADRTYIEPLTREYLEEIIRVERELSPGAGFAVLPTVGGQTALNLAIDCVCYTVERFEPNQPMATVLLAESFKYSVIVLPSSFVQVARHTCVQHPRNARDHVHEVVTLLSHFYLYLTVIPTK